MANTFHALNVHCVFCTKNRDPLLTPEIRTRLWSLIGGIARQNHIEPRCIGGMSDHAHLLLSVPTSLSVAKAMQLIKGGSSSWLGKTFAPLRHFAWQEGYAAFGVSFSHLDELVRYIQAQEEHHRTKTFREEYLGFLQKHRIQFDEKFALG
ncbi:MAG: IS200/IS605 family transposase [Verrucomicrobia bacterium]|nr:IS200/IS605 family transposase [Verrucomicrobiota bacterium]